MENINILFMASGRKVRRGVIDNIGGYSFAIVPDKAKSCVHVAMPGAQTDFLQVMSFPWDAAVESFDDAVERIREKLVYTNPARYMATFSETSLEAVRAKTVKRHKDYILGLLADYEAYNHKPWQPATKDK